MVIGIDASRANKKEKTGTEWYSYFLIEEWKKILGETSSCILYSDTPLTGVLARLPSGWQSRVLTWPFRRLWTQGALSLEMLRRPPDALFAPAHTIPLFHPKKTFTTLHDVGFKRFPELYSPLELRYHDFSARLALRRASHIVTVSEFSKREMVELYGADPAKITVVWNGYDAERFTPLPKEAVARSLAERGMVKPYLFFVGRLEEKKNVARLVRVFARVKKQVADILPDLELVLAGRPGYYGYKNIEQTIRESGCADSIRELHWVKSEDLPALYNGAELFVFPSLYEGFGIPVVEAFACGTPVIASKSTALPEVVGEAGILIDPKDEPAWIETIVDALRHPEKRDAWREKGLQRAKLFSWKKCAKETWEIVRGQSLLAD